VTLTLEELEGTVSAYGTVNVTNASGKNLKLGAFKAASPFSQTNNCGTTLAAGASCSVSVAFTPTQPGTFHGRLTLPYTGTGSPQFVPLTGIGDSALSFNPPADFKPQLVGTTVTQFAGIGNGTPHPAITVSSVTVEGTDFSLTKNGCPSTYPPFTGCDAMQISFTPSQTGLRTGTLTVVADDSPQAHVLALQGVGISSGQASLSTSVVDFGVEAVGTTSKPVNVTVMNVGTGPLGIAKVAVSPAFFKEGTTCPTTLAAGASCTISVRFLPTLQGILAGMLTIQDDGLGGPHAVDLVGVGQ
jgi:hypothetical protein